MVVIVLRKSEYETVVMGRDEEERSEREKSLSISFQFIFWVFDKICRLRFCPAKADILLLFGPLGYRHSNKFSFYNEVYS